MDPCSLLLVLLRDPIATKTPTIERSEIAVLILVKPQNGLSLTNQRRRNVPKGPLQSL